MEYADIVALAPKFGINGMTAPALQNYQDKSDGLSGGVSWLYSLRGAVISCHKAGVAHDWLYERGGTSTDRLKADLLFCVTAAMSGKLIPGWLERWFCQPGQTGPARLGIYLRNHLGIVIPFMCLAWRVLRAIGMCGVVRAAAWGKRHWSAKKAAP